MSNLNFSQSSEEELPSTHQLCDFRSNDTLYLKPQVYPLRPAKKSSVSCTHCNSKYNNTTNLPFLLPSCGHTFCKPCLSKMSYKSMIRCTLCNCMTYKELKKLPVNYALLEACESRSKKPLCKDHSLEIMGYCLTDELLICGQCTFEHRSHKILLLTTPEIQEIALSKKSKLEQEEEDLLNLQATWGKIKEEHFEGIKSLQSAVSKHKISVLEMEREMVGKVSHGVSVCLKELDKITGDEFLQTKEKVKENIDRIKNRLFQIKEIRNRYDNLSIVEKIQMTLEKQEISLEEPPNLDFIYKIIEKLKGNIDYESCIKKQQLIIN